MIEMRSFATDSFVPVCPLARGRRCVGGAIPRDQFFEIEMETAGFESSLNTAVM
jgi:hypothetical protein